jgi:hypothetical protein
MRALEAQLQGLRKADRERPSLEINGLDVGACLDNNWKSYDPTPPCLLRSTTYLNNECVLFFVVISVVTTDLPGQLAWDKCAVLCRIFWRGQSFCGLRGLLLIFA